ncbi:DMT family transporter [Fluviispira vulneris]|uniref:DMT family transporter n=1 Tax=Fluviispira vulneris TaxID=2763012 RepID=UPI001643FCC1|nr:DMT family transporter [Fluviispira vulneris]
MINIFMFIFCILVWGSSYLFAKMQNSFAPPEFSLMLRILVAFFFFIPLFIVSKKNQKLKKKDHFYIFLFGICNFMLGYIFLYFATVLMASGLVVVIFSFKSILTPLLISIKTKQKLNLSLIIGSLFAILGVFFILMNSNTGENLSYKGLIFAIAGTVITSFGDLFSSMNNDKKISPIGANFFGLLYIIPVLVIINLNNMNYLYQLADLHYLLSILYLGLIASGISWLFYLYLVKNIGANYSSYMVTLFPVVGCLSSILFESMQLDLNLIIGIMLNFMGLFIVVFYMPKKIGQKNKKEVIRLA